MEHMELQGGVALIHGTHGTARRCGMVLRHGTHGTARRCGMVLIHGTTSVITGTLLLCTDS